MEEARGLAEAIVQAQEDHQPEAAKGDPAILPLVEQYGVLLWVPRPEGGSVAVKVVGPSDPVRDAAALLEARYVKGRKTASVLHVPDQQREMAPEMAKDLQRDLDALGNDQRVKVVRGSTLFWVSGRDGEFVARARTTLREVLQFYIGEERCLLMEGLRASAVDRLRQDENIRALRARPRCVIAFDRHEGTAWICGDHVAEVKRTVEAGVARDAAEHWEHELEDYGAAMWLLGPGGSGEYAGRIQAECGARVFVCPNARRVWVDGTPPKVAYGKQLVLEALQKLDAKKRSAPAEPERSPDMNGGLPLSVERDVSPESQVKRARKIGGFAGLLLAARSRKY